MWIGGVGLGGYVHTKLDSVFIRFCGFCHSPVNICASARAGVKADVSGSERGKAPE